MKPSRVVQHRVAVHVVIGSRKALSIANKGRPASRRWSKLKEWLAT